MQPVQAVDDRVREIGSDRMEAPVDRRGESRVDAVLGRLRRVTTSGRYLPQVDGIRFVAIASVFLFHVTRLVYDDYPANRAVPFGEAVASDLVGRLLREGRFGVMVFFALSGFILGLPFLAARVGEGHPVSLRAYFLRRLTRIEPPYLAALVLVTLLALVTDAWGPPDGVAGRFALGAWYGHTVVHGVPNLLNPPFWTLEIEVQFYLVMPLLALVLFGRDRRRRRAAIAFAAVALTVLQAALGARLGPGHPLGILPNYLQWFLIGFLVADVFVVDWHGSPTTARRWDLVSLVGWPLFFLLAANEDALTYLVLPWMLLPLFVAVFRGTVTSRALGNRWVTTIGGMTYSIYLVHTPVIDLVGRSTTDLFPSYTSATILAQAAILAPVVLLAGLVFYVVVERPCMDPRWPRELRRRLSVSGRGRPSVTAAEEATRA
jgi:peptidoglycan/LPS O-acetylase OafA/YrhL